MAFWNRTKSFEAATSRSTHSALKPTLSWVHLVGLGVGGIVGTGILTLTGVGAGVAGPGVILSFVIAGVVCAAAALAYAEMATMMPMAGSAYTYTYVALGELLAWIVGWTLILEYTVVCSAVAVGWSGYAAGVIRSAGWGVPEALLAGPYDQLHPGGLINVPAIFISLAVAGLLAIGSRESATVNLVLVGVKLVALAIFIALALPAFDANHFEPFAPFGYGSTEIAGGKKVGVMAAAAIIFFAFYGFDAVSTAAEETKNPKRDLKIGIVGSMILCTLLYMVVATAALGGAKYTELAASSEPLALVLRILKHPAAATVVGSAAVIALPTVIMAFMYGQSRIFFVMARDGLLPQRLSAVNPRSGTPVLMTFITSIVVALVAAFVPLDDIASVANAGTLIAFIAVAVCMMVTRRTHPQHPRMFSSTATWIIGVVAVIGCIWLFSSLRHVTMLAALIWNVVGLAIYLLWARRKSLLEPATG
ncbi:MAG TPA: amino acid permease [Steroidobacteraceae bacterium]|jgi:APA family basic amino acid/polyamine antiporter